MYVHFGRLIAQNYSVIAYLGIKMPKMGIKMPKMGIKMPKMGIKVPKMGIKVLVSKSLRLSMFDSCFLESEKLSYVFQDHSEF